MKFKTNAIINSYDVDFDQRLTLNSVARFLQQAAINHSNHAGYTTGFFAEKGFAWVLHKVHFKILEDVDYLDEIEFVTWSKGAKAFYAFRDFIIKKGEKTHVAGSSLWLLLDINTKRPVKVKPEIVENYTVENDNVLESDILRYKPAKIENAGHVRSYNLRVRDFDINRHLNNSVYIELVEDSFYRIFENKADEIKIMYQKEVDFSVDSVDVRIDGNKDNALFEVCKGGTVFALGEIRKNS